MRCHAPILVALILVLLLLGASPLVAVADDEWTLEDSSYMQAMLLHLHDLTSEGAPAEVEGRPLHEWILLLGKDAAQRVEAERVLAGLGPAALPALVAGLGGRPFGWSEPSARLLARLLPTEPESLRRWLGDRRPARRAAAAWFALARIGGDALESAVPRLAARLDGTDATHAFIALARAGEAGRDLLFRRFSDPEMRKRVAALWWFRGEVIVAEGMAGLLDASSRPVRAWVAKTLDQLAPLPPTVTPALVTALADESTQGPRQDAEDALVVLGAVVVPHVTRLMQRPSAPAAVAVLGRLGERAWPALTAALTAPGPAAVEHLAALLEADAGYDVPRIVTRALVALGPSSAPVLPRLLRLEFLDWGGDLEDGSRHYPAPTAETFVGQIVVAIGAPAVPYLCEAVASVGEDPTDAACRAKAFRLLRLLGPVASSALPMLREEAAAGRIDLDEEDFAPVKAE